MAAYLPLLVSSLWLGAAPAAPAGGVIVALEREQQALFDAAAPSVVYLRRGEFLGSGFFVREEGLVVTNAHVVGDAEAIEVVLLDGRRFTGKVVQKAAKNIDLALVRVPVAGVRPLALDALAGVRVGRYAASIGQGEGAIWTFALPEIALLLGFSEQSAFNNAFKRWTGTTPGAFRNRCAAARLPPGDARAKKDLRRHQNDDQDGDEHLEQPRRGGQHEKRDRDRQDQLEPGAPDGPTQPAAEAARAPRGIRGRRTCSSGHRACVTGHLSISSRRPPGYLPAKPPSGEARPPPRGPALRMRVSRAGRPSHDPLAEAAALPGDASAAGRSRRPSRTPFPWRPGVYRELEPRIGSGQLAPEVRLSSRATPREADQIQRP